MGKGTFGNCIFDKRRAFESNECGLASVVNTELNCKGIRLSMMVDDIARRCSR